MNYDADEAGNRRRLILAGARAAFLRFGFQRTSVADVAREAGVTRTALYHYFSGKEEIFRAVVDELHVVTTKAAREVLSDSATRSLDVVLLGLFVAKFDRTLDLLTVNPHGLDLIDATHRLAGPAIRSADDAFHALVVEALTRGGCREEVGEVADTMIAAAKGLLRDRDTLVSTDVYRDRLHRLIGWAVR